MNSDNQRAFAFVLAAACSVAAAAPSACAQVATLTRVLANGDALEGGSNFNTASAACIGPGGHIVVRGSITTIGLAAVVAGQPGGVFRLLAHSSQAAPGAASGVLLSTFVDAWPDAAGRVILLASLSGSGVTTSNDRGLYVHNGTLLVPVIREGDPAPGLPAGTTIATINSFAFSNGRVAYVASVSGTGVTTANDSMLGVFNVSTSTHTLVAREGDASAVAGLTWTGFHSVLINSAGTLAFVAAVNSSDVLTDSVVITGTAPLSSLLVAAREGAQAPGLPAGFLFFGDFGPQGVGRGGYSLNDAGEVLIFSVPRNGATSEAGLWRRSPGAAGTLTAVALSGSAAPGLGSPAPLIGTPQNAALGGTGALVWDSTVSGSGFTSTSDRTIFRRFGVGTAPLAREGAAAPGEDATTTFGLGSAAYFFDHSINGRGRVLMTGSITGPAVVGGSVLGAYGSDPAVNGGAPFKLFHGGETVGVAGIAGVTSGSLASFTFDESGGTQYGLPCIVNDSGTAVVRATITGAGLSGASAVYTVSVAPTVTTTGACCDGATCSVTASTACACAGQRFAGAATVCNSAGNSTSPCCLADFNQSGGVSVQDIFDFLSAFFTSPADLSADINGSGTVTVQDVFDYLAAFFAGCL